MTFVPTPYSIQIVCLHEKNRLRYRVIRPQIIFRLSSTSAVFESYQVDGWMIMKGRQQWNPVCDLKQPYFKRDSNQEPLDQHASVKRIELTGLKRVPVTVIFDLRTQFRIYLINRFLIIRYMDDLRFNVLFNSVSIISGRRTDDNERLYAIEPRLRLRRFRLGQGSNSRQLDQ